MKRTIASFSLATLVASFFAIGVAQAQTFPDVNPSDWYYSYVEDLVTLGVVNSSMPSYRPGDNVNRAEMAKLVVEAFEIDLVSPETATFKDVASGTWYYEYVETAAAHGIVGGYKDTEGNLTGYYGPGDDVTREQAAKMIVLGAPLDTNTNCGPSFPDVPLNRWSYEYVETLYVNSVVDGYPDGTFGPENLINRAEIAKIVSNGMAPVLRPCGGFSVAGAEAMSATTVEVCYTMEYDETSAMMSENYAIEDVDGNALAVTGVEATSSPDCVLLTTDAQNGAKVYDLLVTDVLDADGMELLSGDATFNGYTVGNVGDLTVTLDGSTPDSASIPQNGSNILYSVFGFEASADEDVEVEQLVITRQGLGLPGDFKNLKLYVDGVQKGSEKTLNTTTNTATFNLTSDPIVAEAGKRVLVEVRADMAGIAGSENKLCLAMSDDVTAYGGSTDEEVAVAGSFAICGELMKTTNATVGTLTYTVSQPSTGDINVGDKDVSFVKVKLEEANEDVNVTRITFKQGGSADLDYFGNLHLISSGSPLEADMSMEGDYVTFDLSENPLFIQKGNSKTLELWGDVTGGLNTTAQFDIYRDWHIEGTGTVYGYGVNVVEDTITPSITPVNRDIIGGNIAFATSSENPVTGDVAKGARDFEFLRFNISTAGDGVTVRELNLTVNAGGGGSAAEIEDLKIWGKNSSDEWVVVAGPDNVAALGNVSFTDTFDVPAASTNEYIVTADITNTALTGMTFSVDLANTLNPALTELEYLSDGTAVDEANEVTGGTLIGNTMTVAVPSVTVTRAATPGDKTYVKNTTDRDLVAFDFAASTASDIRLTGLTLNCLGDDNGVDGNRDNDDDADTSDDARCSDAFQTLNLYLVEGSTYTKLAGPKSLTKVNYVSGTSDFSLNFTIEAGDTARLLVRGNVASAAVADSYDFTIQGGKVTAEDSESSTATVNGLPTAIRVVSVAGAGAVTNQGFADDNTKGRILVGLANDQAVMKVRFSADPLEGWVVKKMTFTELWNPPTSDRDFVKLYVTYVDKAGTTQKANASMINGVASFTNLNAYVPANGTQTLLVSMDVPEITGGGAQAGDLVQVEFDGTLTFEAVGESSGTQMTELSVPAPTTVTGDTMRIAKSAPVFTKVDASTTLASGEMTVYKWTVAANGAGDIALKSIAFDSNNNLAGGTVNSFKLYKNGSLVSDSANVDIMEGSSGNDLEPLSLNNLAAGVDQVVIWWDSGASGGEEIITKGTSASYELKATFTGVASGDDFSLAPGYDTTGAVGDIDDSAGNYTIEVDASGVASESYFVWSDMTAAPHDARLIFNGGSSVDWMDGYLVQGLSAAGSQVLSKS